ncbi:DUF4337 domain-containing protein [Acidiferrobacter sp.]|jgi:hypothetical protein|uniref:DUF4337 domain-containing protein n=2 Tax=Acidiferrobacter sp. TaxID=1872107 RepID=UPI002603DCFD|nr:DUF4337 domain-containing protein [Acidiferrobacter sp.]
MTENGVHTHAPHEEFVQEAARGPHKHHSLNQWVAIFTAILASIGAVVSYQGTRIMNEVLLYKNEAILQKTHAADQWNYYQAVSTKAHIMQLALALLPPAKAISFRKKIVKYAAQKVAIKAHAGALESRSKHADRESARLDRPHNGMALSLIFIQIAISLASITALTGRKWLFVAAGTMAIFGVGLWGYALWLM